MDAEKLNERSREIARMLANLDAMKERNHRQLARLAVTIADTESALQRMTE